MKHWPGIHSLDWHICEHCCSLRSEMKYFKRRVYINFPLSFSITINKFFFHAQLSISNSILKLLRFLQSKPLKLVLGNTTFKRLHSLTISNQLSNSLFFQYRNKTIHQQFLPPIIPRHRSQATVPPPPLGPRKPQIGRLGEI